MGLQVLLVTSSSRPDRWIVPGGGVEPDEDPHNTAMREVEEEAGVLGTLVRNLGIFEVRVRIVPPFSFILSFIFPVKNDFLPSMSMLMMYI